MPMTTLDTRPRAPALRPLSLGSTGRKPGLKMAMAPPAGHPVVLRLCPDPARDTPAWDRRRRLVRLLQVAAGRWVIRLVQRHRATRHRCAHLPAVARQTAMLGLGLVPHGAATSTVRPRVL